MSLEVALAVVVFLLVLYRHILGPWLMHQILYKWFCAKFAKYKIQSPWPSVEKIQFDQAHSIRSVFLDLVIIGIIFLMLKVGLIQSESFLSRQIEFSPHYLVMMVLNMVVLFFIQDFYFYVTHRAFHQFKFLKKFHHIHHHSTNPTPWTSFSHHWVEGFVELLFYPLVLLFLSPDLPTVLLYVFLSTQINFLGHCGFEFESMSLSRLPGFSWVMRFEDHNRHHQKFHGNYALYFKIWDQIFKTGLGRAPSKKSILNDLMIP